VLFLPWRAQDEDSAEEGATLLTRPEASADDSLAHTSTAEPISGSVHLPIFPMNETLSFAEHKALRPSNNVPKGAPPVSAGGNLTSAPTLEAASGSRAVHPPIADTFDCLISRLENPSFWHIHECM
jgi:hypothetical protein